MNNKIGRQFHLLNIIITFSSRNKNNNQTLLSIPGRRLMMTPRSGNLIPPKRAKVIRAKKENKKKTKKTTGNATETETPWWELIIKRKLKELCISIYILYIFFLFLSILFWVFSLSPAAAPPPIFREIGPRVSIHSSNICGKREGGRRCPGHAIWWIGAATEAENQKLR
jgi:hypothetical protein